MKHELKILPIFFFAVEVGLKTAELRKNDRDFKVGDKVTMKEFEVKGHYYTGESIEVIITHVLKDVEGIDDDYCIFSFKVRR